MKDLSSIDYSSLDRREILAFLFHPRKEFGDTPEHEFYLQVSIPVREGESIGADFYSAGKTSPTILFFHGNGEIVEDYQDLGPVFRDRGFNFFPVDYRGYGRSTGRPTVTAMMRDCHEIYDYVRSWLKDEGYKGLFLVMGRSIGSASALELASSYSDDIDGLIIESGFAFVLPLLRLIGVNTERLGLTEDQGFDNREKIELYSGPTLVIHAENDHIIPFHEGEALYKASKSADKRFLAVPDANHNTIFMYGFNEYLKAVSEIAETAGQKK